MTDYFFIELKNEKLEEAFLELKEYITEAVDQLKKVHPRFFTNRQEIFNELKRAITQKKNLKVISKFIKNIPIKEIVELIFAV